MIIGICGLQNSGKDTIGAYLVDNYGFIKISFASLLKDIVAILFDWDRKLLEGDTVDSREWREQIDTWWSEKLQIPNLTPRYVLQFFGTDLFRDHFHQDIWIIALERQLFKWKNCVITDCRFPNEIQMIRKAGGKIIRVDRGKMPTWYYTYMNSGIIDSSVHQSEYMWVKEEYDYLIENNSTLVQLEKQIIKIINLQNYEI